jgi:hypothetical protein
MLMKLTRRKFVKSTLAGGAIAGLLGRNRLATASSPSTSKSGILFEGIAIQRKVVQEAILSQLKGGAYWLLYSEKNRLVAKISTDRGRTWGETTPVRTTDGSDIPMARDGGPHLSLLRPQSGELGMIYGGPYARQGRDGTLLFRTSQDEGRSWSPAVIIDSYFSVCRSAAARVLSTGRIVAPVFAWISAYPGGESESEDNSFCYTWIYYSDDKGRSWRRSLSESFVSLNQQRNGSYSFEEPVVEELRDGRLLMVGRTELGRQYQSFSKMGGSPGRTLNRCHWHLPIRLPHSSASLRPVIYC